MFPPVPSRARGAWGGTRGVAHGARPCASRRSLRHATPVVGALVGLLLGALTTGTARARQVDEHRTYDLVDGDLDQGLFAWTVQATGTGSGAQGGTHDGRSVATLQAALGGEVRLARALLPGGPQGLAPVPAPGRAGERPVFRARVWVEPGASSGSLALWLLRAGPGGDEVLGRSVVLPATEVPRGRWFDLVTEAAHGPAGRLASDTLELRVELRSSLDGPVHLDLLRGGRARAVHHPLPDPGFEHGAPDWQLVGAEPVRARQDAPARRGAGCLALDPGGVATTRRALAPELDEPWIGERPVLGAWVLAEDHPALPSVPSAAHELRLLVRAQTPAGPALLGIARWRPTRRGAERWVWLEVANPTPLPADATELELVLDSTLPGRARVDELQLGPALDVDGQPLDLVLCSHVGWYRSPAHPLSTGPTASPRERWGNWAWEQGTASEPGSTAFLHDPAHLRSNGRRDGAVGETDGPDALPLVGLYDSRDADVARLTVDLAGAAGVDALLVDWHGAALDDLATPAGEPPLQGTALEVLVDAADRPGCDVQVGLMLEPKVHQLGWVHPGAGPAARRTAFVEEVAACVRRVAHRRPMLRIDGELVLGVFWHDVPAWDGTTWDAGDWAAIEQQLEQRTGEALRLFATHPPGPGASPFRDLVRWHLADAAVLRFPSYAAYLAGQAAPVAAAQVRASARQVDEEARAWAAEADGRGAWATVWPGFDDSGVGGWGAINGLGADGLPLCVRVSAPPGTDFLLETLGAAHDAGLRRLHLMSWNDWNERTAVEPRWDAVASAALDAGGTPDAAALQRTLGPLLALQAAVGEPDPEALLAPLRAYWARRAAGLAVTYR